MAEKKSRYTVWVDVIVPRTYEVLATSDEDALEKYRTGKAEYVKEHWEEASEDEDTATAEFLCEEEGCQNLLADVALECTDCNQVIVDSDVYDLCGKRL